MVVLRSSDQLIFEIDESVAFQLQLIKNAIEDGCAEPAIHVPNVTSKSLAKVIDYCKRHASATTDKTADGTPATIDKIADEDLKTFDAEFVKVDESILVELMKAANYLNIKSLLELICQTLADVIKDMTVNEIRQTFKIENDFTQREEEEVQKENAWAYE
ncbi:SKP1-like protein 1B [Abeliophyllum distichum]|uniref:SKP1-like protein n=1 Tax=Abeliophyllum distichum TaxID=126358 RepID=A0ABD1P7Z8_9LAMI